MHFSKSNRKTLQMSGDKGDTSKNGFRIEVEPIKHHDTYSDGIRKTSEESSAFIGRGFTNKAI